MRRSMVLAAGFGALALLLIAISATVYVERPTHLSVAVSSSDAEDSDLVGAAAKLLKRGHHSLRLKPVKTEGPAGAAEALSSGRADLAVVRADVAMPANGETVLLLHKDAALLLVPGGAEISKIGDLAGKRIGILSAAPGDRKLLETTLAQYDVPLDAVKTVRIEPADITRALKAGTVDALFALGLVSDGLLPETVKAVAKAGDAPPDFLAVAEAAAVAQRTPGYESIQIVRGAFGGTPPRPADEFDTLGVTYRLVARSDLSDSVVASLTRFLLSERVALAEMAPIARRMEAPATDKGAALPIHPGAAAYIDDEEETFLDRYSDFIYIGAMVLGIMVSAMSALVGRLGSQGPVRAEDLVARLLEIFKLVRGSSSAAALDELEGEVDAIVASALDGACLRSLDERRVAALNMAVEQVRSAIRDRREMLRQGLSGPANDEATRPLDPAAGVRPLMLLGERSAEG